MRVSLIVPAFNEEQLLAATLAEIRNAAAAFAAAGWAVELIVCDNNSTDQTAAIARAAGATVVFEPVNQIALARNTGAAAATGDWLVFIDADSHPSRELFADAAERVRSGRVLACGATLRMDRRNVAAAVTVCGWNAISRTFRLMAGSFICVEAAAFRSVGGFDQEMFAAEEIGLSQRLKRLARDTSRRVVILHRHPLTTSARKVKLYSLWEWLWLLVRVVFTGGRALRNPQATHLWYDGRR